MVTDTPDTAVSLLENAIGYNFNDRKLPARALTHASAVPPTERTQASYERLEFLGDRVLGLICANMLYSAFPTENEGELARRFNALVRRETCAEVALDIGLGQMMILGDSEADSGGRGKMALLADMCESVIAAIYLDGGMQPTRQFVLTHWSSRLIAPATARRDPKTELQEWAQRGGRDLPNYRLVDRDGPDHAPEFMIEVSVTGLDPMLAKGRSKRAAEQAAAQRLLEREQVWAAPTTRHIDPK